MSEPQSVKVLQLPPELSLVLDQQGYLLFRLLARPPELAQVLLDLVLLLFDLVAKSPDLVLIQVLDVLLTLLVGSIQVVDVVLVLSLVQLELIHLLLLDLLDLVPKEGVLPCGSLLLQLELLLQPLDLQVLLLDGVLEVPDVEFQELVVPLLGSPQVLDLLDCLSLILAPDPIDLDLLQFLDLLDLVLQPGDLSHQLVDVHPVLLIQDVDVGIGSPGLPLESHPSRIQLEPQGVIVSFLLLNDLEQSLILLHQMIVLPEEHLNLVL